MIDFELPDSFLNYSCVWSYTLHYFSLNGPSASCTVYASDLVLTTGKLLTKPRVRLLRPRVRTPRLPSSHHHRPTSRRLVQCQPARSFRENPGEYYIKWSAGALLLKRRVNRPCIPILSSMARFGRLDLIGVSVHMSRCQLVLSSLSSSLRDVPAALHASKSGPALSMSAFSLQHRVGSAFFYIAQAADIAQFLGSRGLLLPSERYYGAYCMLLV
jgi:hypothetical protein